MSRSCSKYFPAIRRHSSHLANTTFIACRAATMRLATVVCYNNVPVWCASFCVSPVRQTLRASAPSSCLAGRMADCVYKLLYKSLRTFQKFIRLPVEYFHTHCKRGCAGKFYVNFFSRNKFSLSSIKNLMKNTWWYLSFPFKRKANESLLTSVSPVKRPWHLAVQITHQEICFKQWYISLVIYICMARTSTGTQTSLTDILFASSAPQGRGLHSTCNWSTTSKSLQITRTHPAMLLFTALLIIPLSNPCYL